MKKQKSFLFKNWASNIQHNTPFFEQPATESEIIDLVKNHKKIRVVGTGHSWSALCKSDELLINLDKYNQITNIDKQNKLITVQAGIKLWQLNNLLHKEGLALTNLGSIDQQSLAGAIQTGTHGTGICYSNLASQVLSFTLIKSDGEKIILNKEDELFKAAIISLGCLGIVSEMTLQVCDAFNLHDKTYTRNFNEVIENLDTFLHENNHFKLWWLPPTKDIVVFTYRRTNEVCNDSKFRRYLQEVVLSVWGFRLMVFIGNLFNFLRKPINVYLTNQMKGPLDRIEKSHMVYVVPEPPKHRETEWAFDVKDAKALLKEYQQIFTGNMPFSFNFIQEIRFTKADDFWLSECYERDTIWIGAYNHHCKQWPAILDYFEAFAKKHNGRPHYGKEFNVRKEYLAQQYPKYADFIALRKEMDPTNKFGNELIDELFS
jgi:hypothetical protein